MSAHENLSQQLFMHPKDIEKNYHVDHAEYEDSDQSTQDMWDRKYHEAATNRHTDTYYGGKTKYNSRNSLLANVKKHGVQTPVSLDPDTKTIRDGYHRLAVAREHNMFVPVKFDNS